MDASMEKWQRQERVRELENAADLLLEELVLAGLVGLDDPLDDAPLATTARRLRDVVDSS